MRMTVAQALVRFLAAQHVERDGVRERFFAGCLGIFGHGNVAGLGEALYASRDDFPYVPGRNEQSLVHIAAGYARQRDRLGAYAVTTSIGPGATNLVTGAALATINRLPVLLLPGDTFATRVPHPVLQGLEAEHDGTASVNDALRPVSRYFDRIVRPEQLVPAALEAMRVLTDPAQTGAVTLALPQDVQAEVVDVPEAFLAERTWLVQRQPPAPEGLERAVALIRGAKRPLIVAGGGVIYSRACEALRGFVSATGIPVGETHAGRGALPSDHVGALGAVGATGTAAANRLARDADLVIGVGTRYSDFTTASKTAFQDPDLRFVNVNVCAFDGGKHSGLPLVGDARVTLDALAAALGADFAAPADWTARAEAERAAWSEEVARVVGASAPLTQAAVIGAVNDAAGETGVVVQAAGSLPGDLHKLWVARDPAGKGYHVEYGYSCMGYELPGAMGVKLAAPEREVYVLVGDGSYLMSPGELATAVALGTRIVVVLVQNHGYASIGSLSRSVGVAGFGTHHRVGAGGPSAPVLDDAAGDALAAPAEALPIDLAANVESLGVPVTRAASLEELRAALAASRDADGPVAIHVEVDRFHGVGGYESWWDVPVAAVSDRPEVVAARERYEREREAQRAYLRPA
ncbi:MAG TPA: 3D-(3,5/4)-trihydroxycyclohexane-1,2-dione acylhydrolase (decyclizing) [Baekduia sp.]|uniref:3D-(3,5/4)-trihydroxycyclohexane-1,2-dione acylhydrolase (decyclizing) n=1 Tax=Baekduia sp. TaxID=2600305 RepID=UPI002D77BE5D|nr:3D-(3,5/4)-trihydroxycyclohexane-1,2-dione acylhydrolase (decyclizing) [Baekduia sp.]HET6510003.1 3D-(3,5/4)-trihydroxycyclohexane-1,2-dione acylhydrolase (decyclizing) [Baekduia sp.]